MMGLVRTPRCRRGRSRSKGSCRNRRYRGRWHRTRSCRWPRRPGPVVEILVVVGGLGAAQPVDRDALGGAGEGGGGVVAGVDPGGAADRRETRAVGLDVGVAGRGAGLDEAVVVRDGVGRAVALGGREEQQPELGAGVQAGGLEAPVRGDLGGGLGHSHGGCEGAEGDQAADGSGPFNTDPIANQPIRSQDAAPLPSTHLVTTHCDSSGCFDAIGHPTRENWVL